MKLKKVLYIAVGAPGSGKSTAIKSRIEALGGVHVSRDEIRKTIIRPGEGYFGHEGQVFSEFIKQIQNALDNPYGPSEVYADATHLNRNSRRKLLTHLNLDPVQKIIVLYFDVDENLLIFRNHFRPAADRIPSSALETMIGALEPPTTKEHPLFEIWKVDGYGYITDHGEKEVS